MTPRIASLVPSATETLCALGLAPHLVARTGYCVLPAEALARVPKVGGTKDVNLPKLARLAPSHVIVNVDENRAETVHALRAWSEPPRIVVTHPRSPTDSVALVEQLAAEFAGVAPVAPAAKALIATLRAELDATVPAGPPRRVLYLIWREPWMTVARDTYISRLLGRIGWHTEPALEGGEHGAARYPRLRGDEPWLAGIERVLLSSEPYDFGDAHRAEARELCPNADVLLVDGQRLSWHGVGTIAGLRYLRALAAADNAPAPWT